MNSVRIWTDLDGFAYFEACTHSSMMEGKVVDRVKLLNANVLAHEERRRIHKGNVADTNVIKARSRDDWVLEKPRFLLQCMKSLTGMAKTGRETG